MAKGDAMGHCQTTTTHTHSRSTCLELSRAQKGQQRGKVGAVAVDEDASILVAQQRGATAKQRREKVVPCSERMCGCEPCPPRVHVPRDVNVEAVVMKRVPPILSLTNDGDAWSMVGGRRSAWEREGERERGAARRHYVAVFSLNRTHR